jgi:hypothetical protein
MTVSGQGVDDHLRSRLKLQWDDNAIVELTGLIAFQNLSSKFNAALDVPPQGVLPNAEVSVCGARQLLEQGCKPATDSPRKQKSGNIPMNTAQSLPVQCDGVPIECSGCASGQIRNMATVGGNLLRRIWALFVCHYT